MGCTVTKFLRKRYKKGTITDECEYNQSKQCSNYTNREADHICSNEYPSRFETNQPNSCHEYRDESHIHFPNPNTCGLQESCPAMNEVGQLCSIKEQLYSNDNKSTSSSGYESARDSLNSHHSASKVARQKSPLCQQVDQRHQDDSENQHVLKQEEEILKVCKIAIQTHEKFVTSHTKTMGHIFENLKAVSPDRPRVSLTSFKLKSSDNIPEADDCNTDDQPYEKPAHYYIGPCYTHEGIYSSLHFDNQISTISPLRIDLGYRFSDAKMDDECDYNDCEKVSKSEAKITVETTQLGSPGTGLSPNKSTNELKETDLDDTYTDSSYYYHQRNSKDIMNSRALLDLLGKDSLMRIQAINGFYICWNHPAKLVISCYRGMWTEVKKSIEQLMNERPEPTSFQWRNVYSIVEEEPPEIKQFAKVFKYKDGNTESSQSGAQQSDEAVNSPNEFDESVDPSQFNDSFIPNTSETAINVGESGIDQSDASNTWESFAQTQFEPLVTPSASEIHTELATSLDQKLNRTQTNLSVPMASSLPVPSFQTQHSVEQAGSPTNELQTRPVPSESKDNTKFLPLTSPQSQTSIIRGDSVEFNRDFPTAPNTIHNTGQSGINGNSLEPSMPTARRLQSTKNISCSDESGISTMHYLFQKVTNESVSEGHNSRHPEKLRSGQNMEILDVTMENSLGFPLDDIKERNNIAGSCTVGCFFTLDKQNKVLLLATAQHAKFCQRVKFMVQVGDRAVILDKEYSLLEIVPRNDYYNAPAIKYGVVLLEIPKDVTKDVDVSIPWRNGEDLYPEGIATFSELTKTKRIILLRGNNEYQNGQISSSDEWWRTEEEKRSEDALDYVVELTADPAMASSGFGKGDSGALTLVEIKSREDRCSRYKIVGLFSGGYFPRSQTDKGVQGASKSGNIPQKIFISSMEACVNKFKEKYVNLQSIDVCSRLEPKSVE